MPPNSTRMTYSFKTINGYKLRLDVYHLEVGKSQPAIFWLHGGGLIVGSRRMLPLRQALAYLHAGFAIISVDYRLAPETKIGEILDDVVDAYYWVQEHGESIGIDADHIALVGHSAGAYLALLAAIRLSPKPTAVISFYGYGDISGEWANKPSAHYCQKGVISPEEARKNIGNRPISCSSIRARIKFYIYCRQQGIWGREILGDDHDDIQTVQSLYCPVFSITAPFPPTLLLHGDQDVDVPVSQTLILGRKLNSIGVPSEQIILNGYDHAFDVRRKGLSDPVVFRAFDVVKDFLKQNA